MTFHKRISLNWGLRVFGNVGWPKRLRKIFSSPTHLLQWFNHMGRKSKQPGGHNPLTAHEVKRLKYSGYGTQSTRLSTASHLPFGQCCLSLSPITDGSAVATPSGHVYSREAIVQYLLTKNSELRLQKAEYDRLRLVIENRRALYEEKQQIMKQTTFITKDQGAMNMNNDSTTTALVLREDAISSSTFGRKQHGTALAVASATTTSATAATLYTPLNNNSKRIENSLSHVSYWLASSQPSHTKKNGGGDDDINDVTEFDYVREIEALPPLPPDRPNSPMSGEPLRLKQLVPLHLVYEGDNNSSSLDNKKSSDSTQQSKKNRGGVICSVSHKVITTQPIIALHGHVMLKEMYDKYALPTLTGPVTGRKFSINKHVIELVPGRSGYAASGTVVAKKYNPTLT